MTSARTPAADPVAAALAALWDDHSEAIFEQVGTIERAAMASLRGVCDDVLREHARREAHKLAGSLGAVGLGSASSQARRLEALLTLDEAPGRDLADLVVRLRDTLDRGSPTAAPTPADAVPHQTQTRMLIVEDDAMVAGRLSAEAKRRGLACEVALTVKDARAAVAGRAPDVVLLDLVFDGTTDAAYALLSDLTAEPAPVPVLVFTARDVFTDRVEVARRGGRGFISKTTEPRHAIDQAIQLVEAAAFADRTLLVVDDDETTLVAIRSVLEAEGLRVETLSDPLRFWDELERVSPDMLILDIDMPDVSGLELCRVVRNDPRWAALPVLFVTSRRGKAVAREVFDAGADDYLNKTALDRELVCRVRGRLERARLHRLLAERDALTGVPNRPSSVRGMERLLALSRRYGQPLTIAAIDLDRFKDVNDRHGHAAGDAVLRSLGELLVRSFRGEDIVGRWSGEEFVVAMYGMAREDAFRRMDQLLSGFSKETFLAQGGAAFHSTFSAGIAVFPDDGKDLATLHRVADTALHAAKAAGRNRVYGAGEDRVDAFERPDVVVVDDDDAVVGVLKHSLELQDLRVEVLRDGAEATAALGGSRPKLRPRVVLLDIDLPAVNGIGVLRRLRADGVLGRTNVIVLSSRSHEDAVLDTLDLGAVDHLAKPFSVPVLMRKVARALEVRPSSRPAY